MRWHWYLFGTVLGGGTMGLSSRPSGSQEVSRAEASPSRRLSDSTADLVAASACDHTLVHQLLWTVQQAPSREDFASWLDEPSYEPSDRLLFKRDQQMVAHVQLLQRSASFDGVRLSIGSVIDLVELPEFADFQFERALLAAGERTLAENRAIVGITRTMRPRLFEESGWMEARWQGYTQAATRDVLAHLVPKSARRKRRAKRITVRPWRHVEADVVRAVNEDATADWWGTLCRNEPYWQWLAGRQAYSDLIVAIEGSDDWDEPDAESNIVGYAVMHGAEIVELCCRSDYEQAAPRLLARACQDAIERDHHSLSLHTPTFDPLHELMITAGGSWCTDRGTGGGSLMLKLLNPHQWVEQMYPVWLRRAKASGLDRPLMIHFDTGEARRTFVLTRRSSRLELTSAVTATDVSCDVGTLHALLVGNLNVAEALADGRLDTRDDDVGHQLASLFPSRLFWQSQFDLLRL